MIDYAAPKHYLATHKKKKMIFDLIVSFTYTILWDICLSLFSSYSSMALETTSYFLLKSQKNVASVLQTDINLA